MNRHIKLIPIVGLSVVALIVPSASAVANPLLSGYGGPGQGSQAILGSALVNGPGGGGGGGAAGASGSGSASPSPGAGVVGGGATGVRGTGVSSGAAVGGHSKPSGRPAGGVVGQAKTRRAPAAAVGLYPASERAQDAQGVLGLSADELLYIILALGALALAGVFTRRLARASPPQQGAGS
jgi:hypothetical protein